MSETPARKRSTGPKTEPGKQRVKFNAVTHGIFAEILFQGNNLKVEARQFDDLVGELREAIRPTNALEATLVDHLAIAFIRLARLYVADSEVAPLFFKRLKESTDDATAAIVTASIDKGDEVAFFHRGSSLDLLFPYEAGLDRKLGKLLGQIEQARRIGSVLTGVNSSG